MTELPEDKKVECMITFIKHVGVKEAAKFICAQQDAIDGLTKNNRQLAEGFSGYLNKQNGW